MLKLISKSISFTAFIVALTMLVACSGKHGAIIANIKFSEAELPPIVAEISGFSGPETWGRWSDADVAPTAKIRFKQPLPKQFTLTLTGQSIPNNETAIVKIGNFKEPFYLHKLSDIATIDVTLDGLEDTIEIIPSDPTSPKALGINDDNRKLGMGIATLLIEN